MLFFLLLGGVAGAATLTTASGLMSDFPLFSFFNEAGWVLVTVPLGALIGIKIVSLILLRATSLSVKKQVAAWVMSIFLGFPISLLAPLFLGGAGPNSGKYRYLMFIIEYTLLWGCIIFITVRQKLRR